MGEYITVECEKCHRLLADVWSEEIEKPLTVRVSLKAEDCDCLNEEINEVAESAGNQGWQDGYEEGRYDERMEWEARRDEA